MVLGLSHSLRGECGLKFRRDTKIKINRASLSARRVWIEISKLGDDGNRVLVTLCEESVD